MTTLHALKTKKDIPSTKLRTDLLKWHTEVSLTRKQKQKTSCNRLTSFANKLKLLHATTNLARNRMSVKQTYKVQV